MRIGHVTINNSNEYIEMFKKMNIQDKETSKPYSSKVQFSNKFKPTDIKFIQPNWDNLMTKRDKPAMSEQEFEIAIKELARDRFENGGSVEHDKAFQKLHRQFMEVSSPDRKAIFNESMAKTGGKMNSANAFFNSSGQRVMIYSASSSMYIPMSTSQENDRSRIFNDLYFSEINLLKDGVKSGKQTASNESSIDLKA
jgi:hypothetical protein